MNSWNTVALVTKREISERVRSKAFLFSLAFAVLLIGGLIVVPSVLSSRGISYDVGVVGAAGDEIVDVARSLAIEDAGDREVGFDVFTYPSVEAADVALADGAVEIVLIDGVEMRRQSSAGFGGSDLEGYLQRAAASADLASALQGTDRSVQEITDLFSAAPLGLTTVEGPDSDEDDGRSLVAYGGLMLMYFAILSFGAWTLTGITEEKASRVVEVLLSSTKPWQLLAGKILGIGVLGLGQFLTTVAVALVLIRVTNTIDLPAIPVDSAITLIVWFILGYAVYSVSFGAAGAVISRIEDAQTAAFPMSMMALVGFIASFRVLDNPDGPLAVVASFIPFTAAFVVPIRVAFQAIPVWQYALAIAVCIASIVGLVLFAGRVYAGGLLHYGGRMKLREAYRAAETM